MQHCQAIKKSIQKLLTEWTILSLQNEKGKSSIRDFKIDQ